MLEPPINQLPVPDLIIGSTRLSDASGGEHDHIYAATGRITRSFPLAGAVEVDAAVREARAALSHWRMMPGRERSRILRALGEAVLSHAEQLAAIQTIETGVPIAFSKVFPEAAASHFLYNAGWADKVGGEVVAAGPAAFDYTMEEPYGVVGAIIPWNASLIAASQVLAPILTTGNTVVMKPPELAPFASLRLAELALEAGVPPGVINIVTGGAAAGESLVRHPGVSKIQFTGSRETARQVLAAAAENIIPVCLELGGKSPLLVFSDADLMDAARQSMGAVVGLSGQGCALPTRVLVEKEVYSRFLVIFKGLLRRVAVGDPLEHGTQMGPLVSAQACERVLAIIDRARQQQDGTLLAGGTRMDGPFDDGYFIAPTIFSDVAEESALARDEIFGPVLSVMSFEREEDAIRMANSNPYGLAAYLFTNDLRRAHRVGAALEVGTVWINGMDQMAPSMPFGGYKQSGYGRLGGHAGIREFTRSKNVWLPVGPINSSRPL